MKKIQTVSFNDFRAFKGNITFDFTTKVGKIADFICIYGQNGMGKSSFFDGIEWSFTGKIHRMEKDIKTNVGNYSGNILKNIYSSNEYASVEIEFDDYETIKRMIKKRANSINDYGVGAFSPKKYRNILSEKQILPHNKIDSFVYATKPSDKYEEWGEFWDPEGNERKIFNSIYKIKKQCEAKITSLDKEMKENEENLNKLILDDETIEKLNGKIQRYNAMSPLKIQKLEIIKKVEHGRLILPKEDELIFYKKELITIKDNLNFNINKLKFLKDNFSINSSYILEKNKLKSSIKRWKTILEFCKQKAEYKNKYNYMTIIKKDLNVKLEQIIEVYNSGNEWMSKYLFYNNMNENIISSSKQIEILNQREKHYTMKIENYTMKLKELNLNYKEFDFKKEKLKLSISSRVTLESKIELLKKEILKLNNKAEKIQQALSKQSDRIEIFNNFCKQVKIIKNNETQNLILEELLNSIEIYVDKSYLNQYKVLDIEISKQKQKILNLEKKYSQSQEVLSDLQTILVNAKNYIQENMVSTCPICASEYKETDILLSKINSTVQQEYSEKLYSELNVEKSILKRMSIQQKDFLISLSNLCENLKNEQNSNRKLNLDIINLIKEEKTKLEYEIENSIIYLSQAKELIALNNLDEQINNEQLDLWICNNKEKIYQEIKQITEEKRQITEEKLNILNKIKKSEEEMEKNILEYQTFTQNTVNKNLIKIIQENTIKTWSDIEKLYSNLLNQIMSNNDEILKVKSYLERVDFVDIDKQLFYSTKLQDLEEHYQDIHINMENYREYAQYLFRNENINLLAIQSKLNNTSRCLARVLEKIDIINDILSQVSISTYNQEYDKLMIKKAEIVVNQEKFLAGREKIADIFNELKNRIETNVEQIFSSNIMNEIYRKIEPHKNFETLKYEVSFNDKDQPEIYIKGASELDNIDVMPELFYSSAQLNTVALSSFLGEALCMRNSDVKTIFIDDPVGHFDDMNILAFVDLIRAIVSQSDWQVVMSTHDESLFNLLRNKLPEEYYNTKYISFTSLGHIKSI